MALVAPLLAMGLVSSEPPPKYLDGALRSWKWILSSAARGDAAWPLVQGDPGTSDDLYHGTAGGVLLSAALASEGAISRRESDRAVSAFGARAERSSSMPAGLYTGQAGVAVVLDRCARLTPSDRALRARDKAEARLLGLSDPADSERAWGDSTDVISGASGIGFALLSIEASPKGRAERTRRAMRLADWLIDRAEPAGEDALKWRITPQTKLVYPNFSHGAAGVSCFLAEVARVGGGKRYLDAALRGARYLESIAIEQGTGLCWPHHEGEPLVYSGWCHGPAGTMRLYYSLWRTTNDPKWLDRSRRCAEWLLAYAEPSALVEGSGYWNVSLCCGVAGVGEALLDWYSVSKDIRALQGALRAGDHLLKVAEADSEGLKWTQAEHRVRPQERLAQTGLMQGAAGIGLFLLRLHAAQRGEPTPAWMLPDNPFS